MPTFYGLASPLSITECRTPESVHFSLGTIIRKHISFTGASTQHNLTTMKRSIQQYFIFVTATEN